ncbi:LIM domain-containing protein PLIM2b, partial [Mucuna pruriens]
MSFTGTLDKCKACDKTVYVVDLLTLEGIPYHKNCFRCSHCKGYCSGVDFQNQRREKSPSLKSPLYTYVLCPRHLSVVRKTADRAGSPADRAGSDRPTVQVPTGRPSWLST